VVYLVTSEQLAANWSVLSASIEHSRRDNTQSLNWYWTQRKDFAIKDKTKEGLNKNKKAEL